jgi:hypothetical protein
MKTVAATHGWSNRPHQGMGERRGDGIISGRVLPLHGEQYNAVDSNPPGASLMEVCSGISGVRGHIVTVPGRDV